jgi:hypothetical protein
LAPRDVSVMDAIATAAAREGIRFMVGHSSAEGCKRAAESTGITLCSNRIGTMLLEVIN